MVIANHLKTGLTSCALRIIAFLLLCWSSSHTFSLSIHYASAVLFLCYQSWGHTLFPLISHGSMGYHTAAQQKIIILLYLKTGAPNLQELMPVDLRSSWCNNNRYKAHNKCNTLESSQNHPLLPGSAEKLPSMKPVSGAKKIGTAARWLWLIDLQWPIRALSRVFFFFFLSLGP